MHRRLAQISAVISVALAVAACDGGNGSPVLPDLPDLSVVPAAGCAADPDFVATDRDGFLHALTHAQPGQTIAIDGMIEIDFDGNVETPDLTFDCYTPGSGLSAAPDIGLWLFIVKAPGVKVQNLVLDATGGYGAYASDKNGIDTFGERVVFRRNQVRCDSPDCVLVQTGDFGFGSGALVEDNVVETTAGEIGIHVQGYTDVMVQGNTIRSLTPSLWAVAVNGASYVHVRHNTTSGSWGRSLAMFDGVYDSDVQGNSFSGVRVRGATFDAVERVDVSDNLIECGNQACIIATQGADLLIEGNTFTSQGSATGVHAQGGFDRVSVIRNRIIALEPSTDPAFGAIRVRTGSGHVVESNDVKGPWTNGLAVTEVRSSNFVGNRISGPIHLGGLFTDTHDSELLRNVISGAGTAGVLMDLACHNTMVGNNLQLNGGFGLVLGTETGANTYVGNRSVVADNGAYDCDGDGLIDPNVLLGQGTPITGMPMPQPAVSPSRDNLLR